MNLKRIILSFTLAAGFALAALVPAAAADESVTSNNDRVTFGGNIVVGRDLMAIKL